MRTKLRTRLLNDRVEIIIGKYIVSSNHLFELIDVVSKDKHLLTKSHLKSDDKMNFDAVEKMVSEKVQVSLSCVPNSEGTTAYLKITQLILDAFLKKDLDT
ncbi:hypothetical protein NQ314_001158 [Rhamnusium bicolor]|uniref:Uncharacterized protein n=1 Tax=Rhamnusium bicolor TaxID=1586634 RepID=A0AAV8ZU63_9CUCU|nr:hypothetical protein NQ314_001158 [Rhamnusium bicolor]